LEQIRQRIQEDPNYLQTIMADLQVQNPALYAQINQDPNQMLGLLLGGPQGPQPGPQPGPRPAPHESAALTEEEKAAIYRVLVRNIIPK
jgi:hypothetical protein